MSGYHGHMTMADGSHVPLTSEQAKALWDQCERAKEARQLRLPDEDTCRKAMFDAYDRLKEFGWREAIYCPKDGTHFDAIEAGSTGIFESWYEGEWPDGHWYALDGGDIWPARPILFRLREAVQSPVNPHPPGRPV